MADVYPLLSLPVEVQEAGNAMSLVGFKAQNHPQQEAKEEVDDRETTDEDFARFNERFDFTIDVAAAQHNAKLPRFFTKDDDALQQSWKGERVWCNPPYSDIRSWVEKAWAEWTAGAELIVMLLPANRTEQRWWQDLVEQKRRMIGLTYFRCEFLPGRMRFIRRNAKPDPKGDRPPFGNVLLIWGYAK